MTCMYSIRSQGSPILSIFCIQLTCHLYINHVHAYHNISVVMLFMKMDTHVHNFKSFVHKRMPWPVRLYILHIFMTRTPFVSSIKLSCAVSFPWQIPVFPDNFQNANFSWQIIIFPWPWKNISFPDFSLMCGNHEDMIFSSSLLLNKIMVIFIKWKTHSCSTHPLPSPVAVNPFSSRKAQLMRSNMIETSIGTS